MVVLAITCVTVFLCWPWERSHTILYVQYEARFHQWCEKCHKRTDTSNTYVHLQRDQKPALE